MKHHQAQSPIGAPGSVAVNPATGAVFAWHPYQTTGEVSALLDAAVRAFREWRAARIEERAAVLIRIGEILRERRHALATTLTSEMGKPISQSRAEVDKCAALCNWYAENAAALMSDEETSVEAGAAYISFLPLGVVLGVMPWNYPLWQPFRAIVPALLAGNGFVLKHAPNCTSTALSVLRVFEAAGAPKGLLSVLVKPGMAAFDEETFGPLAAIVAAADVEDAIRLANHSKYGLSGAIWTEHLDHAKALARRLETGSVFINGYAVSDPRIPIGGVKKSGYGRELSYFGIREFTNSQVVWANRQ